MRSQLTWDRPLREAWILRALYDADAGQWVCMDQLDLPELRKLCGEGLIRLRDNDRVEARLRRFVRLECG